MYEFRVALKYLLFKKNRFSSSLITLLSIFIISIVVWLILVFLSVTNGIEKNWLTKLTSLNAPIRITLTDKYYSSYYYLADTIASNSDYSTKTIYEKLNTINTDPYDIENDMEMPKHFPIPEKKNGQIVDPIKSIYKILEKKKKKSSIQDFQDFEISAALVRLSLNRSDKKSGASYASEKVSFLTQMSYLLSHTENNPHFKHLLIKPSNEDFSIILDNLEKKFDSSKKDLPSYPRFASESVLKKRLNIFESININKVSLKDDLIIKVDNSNVLLKKGSFYNSYLDRDSLKNAKMLSDVKIKLKKDSTKISIPLSKVIPEEFLFNENQKNDYFYYLDENKKVTLPKDDISKVLLPKSYKNSNVLIGDRGYLSYGSVAVGSNKEMRIPISVAGFYDPGVLPLGNKCIIVPKHVTQTINSSSNFNSLDSSLNNGIYVWTKDIKDALKIKSEIESNLKDENLDSYFTVTTYKDFEFSKDLLQQFQSDKTLFTLISIIILLAASSNIISMLILLVNDKKKEIAILRSMGASTKSIALIFGLTGLITGIVSSFIGILSAILTLKNLDYLINFLSKIQGHNFFNQAFFGDKLPSELSYEAMIFVLIITPIFALLAGLIPAIKAAKIHPSKTLRS